MGPDCVATICRCVFCSFYFFVAAHHTIACHLLVRNRLTRRVDGSTPSPTQLEKRALLRENIPCRQVRGNNKHKRTHAHTFACVCGYVCVMSSPVSLASFLEQMYIFSRFSERLDPCILVNLLMSRR